MSFNNILDWYWSVQDTLPGSQVWASARNQYVVLADAAYVAWLALGNTASVIDTQVNLARVFDDYNRTVNRGSLTVVSGSSIQLTSASYYNEVNSSDNKAFMPFVFSPAGWPRTIPYYIKNINTTVLTVYAFDQTTVLGTISVGEIIFLFPTRTNDSTGVGIWSFFHLPTSDPSNAANLTSGLVALARGGTHADLSAMGGTSKFLRQNSTGADIDVVQPASTDLSDFSTGSWTPSDASGASLTFSTPSGFYIKLGSLVFACGRFIYPATASGSGATIGGLPFTVNAGGSVYQSGFVSYSTVAILARFLPTSNTTTAGLYDTAGTQLTNAHMSGGFALVTGLYLV